MKNIPPKWADNLRNFCNAILEDENAAYRVLDSEVVEITDEGIAWTNSGKYEQ